MLGHIVLLPPDDDETRTSMIKQTPFQRPGVRVSGQCPARRPPCPRIRIASQRTAATKQIRSQTDTYNYSELLKINLNCDEPYFCPAGCILNLIFLNPDKFALSLIFSFDYKAKECKVSSHPLSKLLCYIYI